ncbi:MAG TPA: acyltransferase [Acidobacteriaceae bacterium]|nr:acyltransferase [Acidobacteriaceae bacterium]
MESVAGAGFFPDASQAVRIVALPNLHNSSVPRNRPKNPEPNHKPELDGIRGFALLAVMLSHGGPLILRGGLLSKLLVYAMIPGWAGVELFFVLSGFLIAGILLKSKSADNYFSSFYIRRCLRIFPIYYLVVTVGLIVSLYNPWWNSLLPSLVKTRVAYYFYLQNWPIFWGHGLFSNGVFGHFWSLAVEEQFYLVCPMVIWLLPENSILWLCTAGLVAALPFRFFIVQRYAEDFTAMALTSSRIDGLLIGVMLAIFLRRGQIPIRWVYLMLATGGAIVAYIAVFHHTELVATYFYMPTIGITAFSLLSGGLLALSQRQIGWLRYILTARWLRTTGKYSYGMYIYHVPVYAITDRSLTGHWGIPLPLPLHLALPYMCLLFAITFLVAKISYDYFESKILALKIHFRPRFSSASRVLENPVRAELP